MPRVSAGAQLEVALGQGSRLGRPAQDAGEPLPEVADLVRQVGDHDHARLPVGRLVRDVPTRKLDGSEQCAVLRTATRGRSLPGGAKKVMRLNPM